MIAIPIYHDIYMYLRGIQSTGHLRLKHSMITICIHHGIKMLLQDILKIVHARGHKKISKACLLLVALDLGYSYAQ